MGSLAEVAKADQRHTVAVLPAGFGGLVGRGRRRRLTGVLVAVVVAAVLGVTTGSVANAAPGDTSNASAQFLSGSLLLAGVPLDDVASLRGAQATNNGNPTPVTDTGGLDLTALNALGVSIPGGISLGLLSDLLQLGAVNQYAQASDNGVSRAASGAVANDGTVDNTGTGTFPASAGLTLTPLLSQPPFAGVLDQLGLSLQAVTGIAALDTNVAGAPATTCADLSAPVHCRDYNIAGGGLNVRSPLVASLTDLLVGTGGVAENIDAAVATLTGPSGLLAQALATLDAALAPIVGDAGLTVTITSDVAGALNDLLDTPLTDGVISIDVRTGQITADLEALLADASLDLANLPPNTELLSTAVLGELALHALTLLSTLPGLVNTALTTALNAATLNISGNVCLVGTPPDCTTPIVDIGTGVNVSVNGTLAQVVAGTAPASITLKVAGLPVTVPVSTLLATLATPITDVLFDEDGAIAVALAAVNTAVFNITAALDPVLQALNGVVSLMANVQEPGSTAGSFREVAARLSVGDILGAGGVGTVDLGAAEVGPNALIAAPTATSLSPDHGPLAGGTVVTVTGSGFVPGVTTVIFDGNVVTPDSVAPDGTSLTFTVPPGTVAGPVPVVLSNGAGLDSAPPLTYTYDAPTVAATSPVLAGQATTVTGGGWPANTDVTLQLTSAGTPVGAPVVVTTTATGDLPLGTTVTVPLDTPTETLTLTATDTFGNTASDVVDVIGAPIAASLSPDHGPLIGGTLVTVDGSGFVPGVTTVIFDSDVVTPDSVAPDGTSLTFTVPPGTVAGPVDVVISNGPGLESAPLEFTFDAPTVAATSPVLAGEATTVTGSGWPAVTDVTLQLMSSATPVGTPVVATTTAAGDLPLGTTVTVPLETPTETLTLTATDTFGNTASDDLSAIGTPVAASLSPNHGPLVGGNVVTVTGSGFVAGTTTVVFDGTSITPSNVASDGTSLTFTVPAGTVAGAVDVVVSNGPALDSTPPLAYTYDAPVVTATSPVLAGAATTVTGTGWPASTQVTLQLQTSGGAAVGSPVTVTTTAAGALPASTTVTVPIGTATQTLTLMATDAFENTASDDVAVIGTPITASLSPNHGPLVGGTVVTVTGSGFVPGTTTVVFDGTSITPSNVASDGTSLTFTVPAGTVAEAVDVVAANGSGLQSTPPLAYSYDQPTITASSPVVAGESTTVTGEGWPAATSVSLQLLDPGGSAVGSAVSFTTTAAGTLPGAAALLVPAAAGAGQYSVQATDAFQNTAVDDLTVEVAAAAAAGGGSGGADSDGAGGALPRTGQDSRIVVFLGLLLMLAGFALIGIGRNLRTASELVERALGGKRRLPAALAGTGAGDEDRLPDRGSGFDGPVGFGRLR